MYALDSSKEYDILRKSDVEIHGPTGYRDFFPNTNDKAHGLSKEDIVRSSIFVHDNNLEESIDRLVSSAPFANTFWDLY
jgi:hypothetical protein